METNDENGSPFSSRYVLVADDGDVSDLPISTLTPTQEALISPDGHLLAAHREIYSLPDRTVTAAIPANAEVLWRPGLL